MSGIRIFAIFLSIVIFGISATSGLAQVRYSGSHHTSSHGGHYSGSHGSSHKGGHYKNTRTNNHYGRHKK
jgi:hypothetical protein